MAVILITNRAEALDPAVRRRVSLHLEFTRPDQHARRQVFAAILQGTDYRDTDLKELAAASHHETPFSYSDLIERVAYYALLEAVRNNRPVTVDGIHSALSNVSPSPLMETPIQ